EELVGGPPRVERVDEDAGEVGAVAADRVVVAERGANRRWARIVELEPDVQESIVVGHVADVFDRRLVVVTRLYLVPRRDARRAPPPLVVQVAVDVDAAGGAGHAKRGAGQGRLRPRRRRKTDEENRHRAGAEPPHWR